MLSFPNPQFRIKADAATHCQAPPVAHSAARCKEPATCLSPPSPATATCQRSTLPIRSPPSLGTMEGGEAELGRGSSFAGYFNLFCKFVVTSCVVRSLFSQQLL